MAVQIITNDNVSLDIDFIEAVLDALSTVDGHHLLDELNPGTACALISVAKEKLERIKGFMKQNFHDTNPK